MKNEDLLTITFTDGKIKEVTPGTSLLEFKNEFQNNFTSKIIAAKVDNDIKELTYQLNRNCNVEFIDLTTDDGMRIYRRTLSFILVKAVNDLFPDRKVIINHSISKGLYFEIEGDDEITAAEVQQVKERMKELVEAKIPFVKQTIPIEEARDMFRKMGRIDKLRLIENRQKPYVTIYSCDDYEGYFYGYMAPNTGYTELFDLVHYPPGVILLFPHKEKPNELPKFKEQNKLFNIFSENRKWGKILEVESVSALNNVIKEGKIQDLIRVSEALHEKKIAQIADMIISGEHKKKVVLIAGPSSSGKTTFSNRLAIQLRVNGVKPIIIALDDYFVDRDKTPKDENGEQDFEALEAIDIELFNEHLIKMLNGVEIEVPIYNFILGKREPVGRVIKPSENHVLVIEGIHALNEKLTASISRDDKFKIYISAITSMNIDDHNRIPTTDTRLLRRIVRDHKFRGSSAIDTIKRWDSVRRGEEKNIFPFQEEADVMLNSSLRYEHGVMKIFAEPLLIQIDRTNPEYSEAKRLLEFLSYFLPIAEIHEIPNNSILREFIGGSCF
jgi:uridine kinase